MTDRVCAVRKCRLRKRPTIPSPVYPRPGRPHSMLDEVYLIINSFTEYQCTS
jgi:hypothetical protein